MALWVGSKFRYFNEMEILALSDLADMGTKRAGPASRLLVS